MPISALMGRLAWLISRVFPRGFRMNAGRRVVLGTLALFLRRRRNYGNAMATSGKLKRGPCNWRPARRHIDREKVIGTAAPSDRSITWHSSSCAFGFRHDRFNDAHDLLTGDLHVRLEQLGAEFHITFAASINDRHVFCM